MLRIVGRTLLVLWIAGLVSGGLYLLAQTDTGRAWLGGTPNRMENNRGFNSGLERAQLEPTTRPSENLGRGRGEQANRMPGNLPPRDANVMPPGGMRERGGHEQISWTRGIAGVTRNLGVMAGLTLGVVALQQTYGWVMRRKRARVM